MRYTIHGLQQKELIDKGLDLGDALLIDTLAKMYATTGFESISYKKERYIWVNQTYLAEYVPILGSKRTIQRRLKKLEDEGIIDRVVKDSKKGKKGTFSYIRLSEGHRGLTEFQGYDKFVVGGMTEVSQGVRHPCRNKDTPYIDTSNKDTTTGGSSSKELKDKEFQELINLHQKCLGFGSNPSLTKEWLIDHHNSFGYEWVKNALLIADEQGKRTKAYVNGILNKWHTEGGMKLSKDKEQKELTGDDKFGGIPLWE